MDTDLTFDDNEFETTIVPLAAMPDLIEASLERCSNGNRCATLQHHIPCKAKVGLLCKMGRLHKTNEWIRVESGTRVIGHTTHQVMTCAYRADQHAYRLKWLGLVRKLVHRVALWQIKPEAIEFLRGKLSIPRKVLVNHGDVYYTSEEQMFVGEIKAVLDKPYWDDYRLKAFDEAPPAE